MIMTKKDEGTYKQVGFIYRNDEIDVSGEVPVDFKTTDGIIGDYTIKGNAYQSDRVSPDTPQKVKAVGDRMANLFDYKKYFESTFTEYNEFFEFAEIQLKPFTTYTFTTSFSEYVGATGTVETAFIITTSTEEPRTLTGGISSTRIGTKTTESDGIIRIYKRIKGYFLPKKEDFDSGMHWLMINEGDTALSYEPYGYKIPVVTRGKNLLEPIGFSAQSITNINDYRIKTNNYGTSLSTVYGGSVLVTQANQIDTTTSYKNGFFYIAVDFSKFTIGKKYTLSFDYEIKEKHSAISRSIAYVGKVTNFVTIDGDWSKDGRKSVTFTVKEGFNPYIEIRLCGNSIFVSNLQIEQDLTATPYEPYHEPITTPIYLNSPLYKIGNYADRLSKTEEVRVIKELILTGNENWIEVGGNANNTTALFTCAINDIIDCGNVVAMDVLTTHYKVGAYYSASVTSEGLQHTRKNIYIRSKQLNVADFKAYLATQYAAGTPVTVYYVLAEPETKSIILPKIPTLDGTNIIDINTEIKPSNISLSRPMTEIKKILNKEGKILFEKGFTREVKSILPLTLNCINKPLKNYTIYGNTVQNGAPTPENPVEVQGVGDYDSETGLYKIPVATSADGTEPITTPIYLDSPLYKIGDYADKLSTTEEVRIVKELVLTGKESWYYMPNYDVENTVRIHSSEILPDRKETMLDLCSHFERMDYHSLNVSNKPAFSIASRTQLVFRVSKAEGSAVTYFKSYLAAQYAAGTPVKVYYVMKTPETKTVEPVEIPTLNGTTVIDVDTAVKPTEIYTKYKSSK